jgi:hypothetical protein
MFERGLVTSEHAQPAIFAGQSINSGCFKSGIDEDPVGKDGIITRHDASVRQPAIERDVLAQDDRLPPPYVRS